MLPLLIQIVGFLWMLSEIALVLFRRAGRTGKDHDAGSIVWLNISIYGSIALAVFCTLQGIGTFPWYRTEFAWLGLVLIVAGLALRWTAILTLRHFFTVDVSIQKGQTLVRTGIFRYLRHPSYTGAILSFIGLSFSLASLPALIFTGVPITAAFIHRMNIEEAALRTAFGDEYTDYQRATWRLIPGIY